MSTNLTTTVAQIELDKMITTAKAFPRSIDKVIANSITTVRLNREIAESCTYAVPRAGGVIKGPSIRLAEIVLTEWGNTHSGTRVLGLTQDAKNIEAEAVLWDLEKNNKITVISSRRAVDKNNRLYNSDILTNTGNAAASIALRNAVFKIIPKAIIETVREAAAEFIRNPENNSVDETKARINKAFMAFNEKGIDSESILKILNKKDRASLDSSDLESLIGLHNSLRDGYVTKEELLSESIEPQLSVQPKKADSILNKISTNKEEKPAKPGSEHLNQLKEQLK